MADLAEIDKLRNNAREAQVLADEACNDLIKDLLRQVADMQRKMDRNAFFLVLIDGDCMNFLDDLIRQGMAGGAEAARLLRHEIVEYLRHDENFNHDQKIIVRVYANIRGLGKTLVSHGILDKADTFSEFVLGFNKAHPLFDFADAGNHKEAADSKIREQLALGVYDVHCKRIVFAASTDNAYPSFLNSFMDVDMPSRVKLVEGPPFSFEFKPLLKTYKTTKFATVFRNKAISKEDRQGGLRHARKISEAASTSDSPIPAESARSFLLPERAFSDSEDSDQPDIIKLVCSRGIDDTAPTYRRATNLNFLVSETPSPNTFGGESVLSGGTDSENSLKPPGSPSSRQIDSDSGERRVADALVSSANEILNQTPKAIDFGTVKARAAEKLGVSPKFFDKNEYDSWFQRSKNIIKWTTEEWVERTNNEPPKNANWMLRYFSTGQSPRSVITEPSAHLWRTSKDPAISSKSSSSCPPPTIPAHLRPPAAHVDVPHEPRLPTGPSRPAYGVVYQNSSHQRLDMPPTVSPVPQYLHVALQKRTPHLCNGFYLTGRCPNKINACSHDHTHSPTGPERNALLCYSRHQRCYEGSKCKRPFCFLGHTCPAGAACEKEAKCQFADLHGMDLRVAWTIREEKNGALVYDVEK